MEKRALGRGLDALLPKDTSGTRITQPEQGLQEIPIHQIRANPYQPRQSFDEQELAQLSESLRQNGMLQPVIVRRRGDGVYELVAGERRWRAAQMAGWPKIPVVIRNCGDDEAMILALEENLQRNDLNPIETARAYTRLMAEFGLTQDLVAQRLGKDRSTVANMARLVQLPREIQEWVETDRLSTGHAKVILGCPGPDHQLKLARQILDGHLSVRQAELLSKKAAKPVRSKRPSMSKSIYVDTEERLQRRLGTRVMITKSRRSGKIVIHFYSSDELDRLVESILG